MSGMLFDRTRIRTRSRSAEADVVHVRLAEEIADRVALVSRRFERALIVGPATPALREVWGRIGVPAVHASPAAAERPDVVADVSQPFLRSFDLAISINELSVANDPVMALGEMRGTLRADGLFLGAAACSGTLAELTDSLLHADAALSGGAAMRVAPFGDVRQWGDALARAGFALPVVDEVRVAVTYGTLASLLADLSAVGLRGVLASRVPAPRRLFAAAEAHYRAHHGDARGRLKATFVFAFLSGWAPDPGQQKPARRGSATVKLEDALKSL
ncbi:SAM-dependent methyltransferase [Acuticoccus sp. I52.16.1]|uniref:SAM-dependent methyltransferase n=1 Tax=Acuticoccus sp. I52.16.1 TaxID=2928472 RepID=UPI001FD3C7DA|nr:SAM-dependent methyltransferase [Acuticoccus sp. I52.16.1]UOM36066.1 SAM-dependent methyltransferase [Acuticoccus sp. I52.16.1]